VFLVCKHLSAAIASWARAAVATCWF
jgi:hypothetical protein